jgi:serine/threonine protein kinase
MALHEFLRNASDYKEGQLLGEGGFGAVYEATGPGGEVVALKRGKFPFKDVHDQELFIREILTLATVNSSLTLRLLGFWLPQAPGEGPAILSPYMKNGTAGDLLDDDIASRAPFSKLTPTILMKIVYGVAFALRLCHAHNIVHRDLKPDNIFMSDDYDPIVADFGLARTIKGSVAASQACGTPMFMAPEMMSADSSDKPIDVYSYAVMLYCLFGRQLISKILFEGYPTPLTIYKLMDLVSAGVRPRRLPEIPRWWWDFIQVNWSQDPSARFTFDTIISVLDDDPGATFPGVNDAEYQAFKDKCRREIAPGPRPIVRASRSQDSPMTRSPGGASPPEGAPQQIVEGSELPAELSRSGPGASGGRKGRAARKPFDFDKT